MMERRVNELEVSKSPAAARHRVMFYPPKRTYHVSYPPETIVEAVQGNLPSLGAGMTYYNSAPIVWEADIGGSAGGVDCGAGTVTVVAVAASFTNSAAVIQLAKASLDELATITPADVQLVKSSNTTNVCDIVGDSANFYTVQGALHTHAKHVEDLPVGQGFAVQRLFGQHTSGRRYFDFI